MITNIRGILILSFLLICTINIYAYQDPYRAIIDKEIYLSEESIYIVQFVYDFDYAKSHIELFAKPSQYYLIQKEIKNGHLVTKEIQKYESYKELMIEVINIEPLKIMRPEIGMNAEFYWYVIDGEYIEENVSNVFDEEQIEIKNISTVYVFDGNSPEEYSYFRLVQVDFEVHYENLYEQIQEDNFSTHTIY
jgi:hypothetical protein